MKEEEEEEEEEGVGWESNRYRKREKKDGSVRFDEKLFRESLVSLSLHIAKEEEEEEEEVVVIIIWLIKEVNVR